MTRDPYDVIVIGAGNALPVAMACGEAGMAVALVEASRLGGTCPNRGCIPSKWLLAHAHAADDVREAGRYHMEARLERVGGESVLAAMREGIAQVPDGIRQGLPAGVDVIEGRATFTGPRQVRVGQRSLTAPRIVLATGSSPRLPGGVDRDAVPYWTSDDVFELETLPASITVVGGGNVGCELADAFAGLGVDTKLVEVGPHLLEREDEEIRARFTEVWPRRIPTYLQHEVSEVRHDGHRFQLTVRGPEGALVERQSEALLYAIGRVPATDGLGLDAAGIETDDQGFVRVDDQRRTSAEGVFALGDVRGGPGYTHSASYEARFLGRRFVQGDAEATFFPPMPHAVFTRPEVAGIGATTQALRQAGQAHRTAAIPYTSAAMGRALHAEEGLLKLLHDEEGRILGCHVVGPQAHLLMHLAGVAMTWDKRVQDLAELIHVHPGLTEVLRNAARRASP